MRIADPLPGLCSVCFNADPKTRYVDFEVAFDGQPVLTGEGTIALSPITGYPMQHDTLYICEPCLRQACELMGMKAHLHQNQLREIRRLERESAHWRETALRYRDEIDKQLSANAELAAA